MKKIMILAIFAIAIFSLVYSGVLNYYGKIVGNVNVQGPIFYADFSQNKLLLNQKPSTTHTASFYNGNSIVLAYSFDDSVNLSYPPKCVFSIKVNSPYNGRLHLECWYFDVLSNSYSKICEKDVTFSTSGIIKTECSPNWASLQNVGEIQLKISGLTRDNYIIESNPQGDTYLQITKAS